MTRRKTSVSVPVRNFNFFGEYVHMIKQSIRVGWQNACITVVLTGLWMGAAHAQEATQTSDLLFVDVQEILVGSTAMLDIRRQVNEQITAIRSDAQEEETALIEEEKKLKSQADTLSEEEIQEGYRKLDERLTSVRSDLSQRLQSVQNGAFEAQREVENQLADIFNSIRLERGAVLLVNPQGILAADSTYRISQEQDVTNEVLTILDERLPEVIVMPRIIPPSPDALDVTDIISGEVTADGAEAGATEAAGTSEEAPEAQ